MYKNIFSSKSHFAPPNSVKIDSLESELNYSLGSAKFSPPLFNVGKKKPGHQLVFLGDSLLDNGNLTDILAPFNIVPYPSPFYSEGKASNGLVLGEKIAQELEIIPDSIISSATVSPLNINILADKNTVNYAFAGATTGFSGSKGNNLQDFPIGLLSQVEQFQRDFNLFSQTPPYKNLVKKNLIHVDGIISAGSNDVFEVLTLPNWFNVLLTETDEDNQALINQTATQIVDNIEQAVNTLGDNLNNIVILGLSPLGDTPFAIKVDQMVDDDLFFADFSGQTRDLLTGIAAGVNTQLITKYDNSENDIEDVLVIDGFQVFNNALLAWEENLGDLTPIKDISYLDYKTANTNLPAGLLAEQFFFLDGSHPLEEANGFIAAEIAPLIVAEFPHFNFA
jgi:phospholipase/lecithinase/hemolysin